MTDFLTELQADIQEENLVTLWRQYGKYVIFSMIAILLATGGYLLWQNHREAILTSQSLQYEKAVALIQEKHFDEALAILDELEKTQDGYKLLAQFQTTALKTQQALQLEASEKREALQAAFAPFIQNKAPFLPLKNLATIELGYALLTANQQDFTVAQAISTYLAPQNPWKGMALELTLLKAFQEKRGDEIKKTLAKSLYTPDVPQRVRARISLEAVGMGLSLQEMSSP